MFSTHQTPVNAEDPGDARPIGALLVDPRSSLAALLAQAEELGICTRLLREWATTHACVIPRVASLRDGLLTLHVDSAAGATPLRYRSRDLLQFLQQRFAAPCKQVSIRVTPQHAARRQDAL
ncbi:MAG TPA: DciA family protein [Nevskiaceae bacterium]|nr:DciA family protein [Nevskiaceae bacterium]